MRSFLLIIAFSLSTISISAAPSLTGITPNEAFSFGPTIIQITGTGLSPAFVRCGDSTLCPIRVWFGEVEGRVISASADRITAEAPAQPEGRTVDVRVRLADGTELVLPQALAYRVNADAGRENFVQYLVPITSRNVPGAHGSLWTSELVVHNAAPLTAYLFGCDPIHPAWSTWDPCWPLQPGQTVKLRLNMGRAREEGAFIHVPRPLARQIDFQLRSRDLSRESEGWGAEVPVVPLEAFRPPRTSGMPDPIRLLNIPVDPRYRATLRVYGGDGFAGEARIDTHAQSDGRLLESRVITLAGTTEGSTLFPGYAQFDPVTAVIRSSGESAVVMKIETEFPIIANPPQWAPLWAFVSITNNVTQEVTVITPHRP
jgi:hypothetical protein